MFWENLNICVCWPPGPWSCDLFWPMEFVGWYRSIFTHISKLRIIVVELRPEMPKQKSDKKVNTQNNFLSCQSLDLYSIALNGYCIFVHFFQVTLLWKFPSYHPVKDFLYAQNAKFINVFFLLDRGAAKGVALARGVAKKTPKMQKTT